MPPRAKARPSVKRRDSSPRAGREPSPAAGRRESSPGLQNRTGREPSPRADLARSLRRELRSLDTDKTGTISRDDLKRLLLELEEGFTDADAERLLKAAVKIDKHGLVDYKEFIDYIVYQSKASDEEVKAPPAEGDLSDGHVAHVFASVPRMAQKEKLDILGASDVEQITMDELLEIQKLHRPPAVVMRILECTCMILWSRESPKPRAPPEWIHMRAFIGHDSFIPSVLEFDLKYLARAPALTRFLHQRFFGKDPLTYERVLRANVAAAALFKWCSGIVIKAKAKVEEPPPEPEPVVEELPPEPEPVVEEPPPEPEPVVEEPPPEPEPIEEELPPEPEPVVEEPPPEPEPVEEEPPPEPEPVVEEPPPEPEPVEEEPPPEPEPVEEELPPEPEPVKEEPPPEPEPVEEELPPEPEPVVEEPPPEPEPVVEEIFPPEEDPLPLTEVELSHLSFRRDAGICPDGWPKDSDCVVCFIWAHLEFRRDAEVCPDGYDEDWQCATCCMFMGLRRFMFGGDMPEAPGLPVGVRHKG